VDLAACWVLSGIHGKDLSDGSGGFDPARAEGMALAAGVEPLVTVPRFAW
jgi:hypothetical protein